MTQEWETAKEPLTVIFKNLVYEVLVDDPNAPKRRGPCAGHPPKLTKTIIHGVDGAFLPGKLTAIMGSSGAGKTTLLKAIAGQAADGQIRGSILINGHEMHGDTMREHFGFVFQDDVILQTMTVREAITMSALLRLPGSIPHEEKLQSVQRTIELLHLTNCAESRVGSGSDKGGISGGEKKRCSIGMELVVNPSILYLDEPTTGLDTYTAFEVMDTLRRLAASGRTVVATIHQPSSDIFHLFDNLLVLDQGQIVYQGDADSSVDYFGRLGWSCPKLSNPADYLFMRILNDTSSSSEALSESALPPAGGGKEAGSRTGKNALRMAKLVDAYKASPMARVAEVAEASVAGMPRPAPRRLTKPPLTLQISKLLERAGKNIIRNPMGMRARFGQAVVMGAVLSLIFKDLDTDQQSLQGRTGFLFAMAMNFMFAAFGVLTIFTQEKEVFEREQAVGMYNTGIFFITKLLAELPAGIVFPVLQMTIVYWSAGLQREAANFFIFCCTHVLTVNAGMALGLLIAASFSSLQVTLIVAPPLILPLMIFSGLFINTDSIPPWFNWIKYLSPIKYAFETYMVVEYTGLSLHCDPSELESSSTCPTAAPCLCPITSGSQVLQTFNISDASVARNLPILVGLWAGWLSLAYITLRRNVRRREAARAKFVSAGSAAAGYKTAGPSPVSAAAAAPWGAAEPTAAAAAGPVLAWQEGSAPPPAAEAAGGAAVGAPLGGNALGGQGADCYVVQVSPPAAGAAVVYAPGGGR